MDLADNTMIGPKKSFERDWKDIRQRLERKIAAAAAQAISGRPGGAEARKPRWATPPKQKEPRFYQVKQEDKLTTRGANPRTGVVSPSNRTDSSCEDHIPRPRVSQKWKVNGDQWVSVDVSQTPSPQSSPLSYKLAKTVSSAGSGSTDMSSSDDWEDRFVVHMPSAKDPNPPSMSVEQIRMYQEKIGRLHTPTVRRHEMDASKPSSGSPQHQSTARPKKTSSIPIVQKDSSLHSSSTGSSQSISPPVDGPKQSYFSPDEVGRARVSPVNDYSKLKQKDLVKKLREECFLGCMGVDEAAAKNPDEILLFPSLDDENESQASPIVKSADEGDKAKSSGIPRSSKLPQLSGQPLARTPPKAPSKEHATPHTNPLDIPLALTAAQSTKIPKPASSSPKESAQHIVKEGEDNALKSTPPASTKKPLTRAVIQGSRTRLAFKTSSRPRNFPSKTKQGAPENDVFLESSSPSSTPEAAPQHAPEQPSKPTSPDFSKTNLEQIPEGKSMTTPKSSDSIRLSPSDIFKDIPGKGPQLYEILSPEEARARNANQKAPKASSVAELDGLQVPQQLPSPPLSTSPSPPPLKAKADVSPTNAKSPQSEKRNTHSIRMEIRMKAEKARQGAAAAKTASERLAAARKHAERLAEARAAYDKAKSQSAAKKTREPLDELKEQKLNTERINEARRAYKAAKAKEEAEKQEKTHQNEAKDQSTPSSASSSTSAPASQHTDTKPVRKPSRKSGAKRPPRTHTINEHEDAAIPRAGGNKGPVNIPNDVRLTDIASGPGAFYLSLIRFHDSLGHNQYATVWRKLGWNTNKPECYHSLFAKTAGYIAIVTSWILWFSKPAGWIFAHVLDAVWE
ncbi:hypothetical protein UA08_07529 [Talaromyces atroroseus]|uniref:Uncharacterized protein n=1 Tax=Talaromyces atroroseus TaxID=1441469 RepID=A0A225AV82_TALAT|nr:hypothetical protein UA08_07529 [Talaromyces atroroseus]OKL57387.1 hypothetical protein UA08_07529 [Talaromyces atroroseus]